MNSGWEGKIVVITGAASGIGLATARLCASLGARDVLLDVNSTALGKVDIQSASKYILDVSDLADCHSIAAGYQRVDLLVTSAAVALPDDPSGPGPNFERMMAVNVRGSLNAVAAFKDGLIAAKGSVVMLSSTVAILARPGFMSYCGSKGAVEQGMRAVALQLAPQGVRVNAVAPGFVWTPLMQEIVLRIASNGGSLEQAIRERCAEQNSGRMLEAREVAEAIVQVSQIRGLTANVLRLDGGRHAGHVPNVQNPGPEFSEAYQGYLRDLGMADS